MSGRPRIYFTEKERLEAVKKSKTKYMLNKIWICTACGNRDYSLAGKWNHMKSNKHIRNVEVIEKQQHVGTFSFKI